VACGKLLLTLACGVFFLTPQYVAANTPQGFLKEHCTQCHGAGTQEADLRLDTLTSPTAQNGLAAQWARVLDMVQSAEMPPPGEEKPEAAEIKDFLQAATTLIRNATPQKPPAVRRMNRREYENTMHDLLGIDTPLADLLPEDGTSQGFDNVNSGLSISSVLMEKYLTAANVAFDSVIRRFQPLPAATRRAVLMESKENISAVKGKKGGVIEVDSSFIKFTPGWPPARVDDAHPIDSGVYRCRIAVWPHNPGGRTLAVGVYTGVLFGPETLTFEGIYDVTGTPDKPRIIEFTTRMEAGHAIHIKPRVWPDHVTWRDKHEKRPGVGIVWCETYGPLDQSFPSKSQKQLFGESPHLKMIPGARVYNRYRKDLKPHHVDSDQPRQDVQRILSSFIPRAFRRPITAAEMQPFIQLALNRLEAGRTFEQAVRAGFTAVVCSPQFLLLNRETEVDNYAIASRLSYFLWSSQPDQQLMKRAAAGELQQPAIRRAEVERMLRDPKIQRFVRSFTGQWLDLNEIEDTTPSSKLYPEFDPLLQEAMLGETRHFFRHLLDEDLSVMNFIDSRFTFLNQRLADHYGIEGVTGHENFQKVVLPAGSVRGGVLSQASVLKVTANGTATSPVIRGVWVMDKILGRPLPPPPPGVPAVEPDIRGAVTIRQQLEKHRSIASCARCHNRIDPPGFALEHFNAIGGERGWYRSLGEGKRISRRQPYAKGPTVETAAVLADGRKFDGFQSFRQHLAASEEQISWAIATKILIYATGRQITAADRSTVETIVQQAAKNNRGLRSTIHAVVESDLFLQP